MTNRFNFRAYIKSLNKIYRVYNLMENGDKVKVIDDNGDFVGDGDGFYKDDFNLMQSTGLTDKNGKEIYEWDIVRFLNKKGVIKEVCGTLVCYWTKDYISNDTGFYNYMPYFPHNDLKLEVIGNIYENDYLLNNKEKSFINVKKLLKK